MEGKRNIRIGFSFYELAVTSLCFRNYRALSIYIDSRFIDDLARNKFLKLVHVL